MTIRIELRCDTAAGPTCRNRTESTPSVDTRNVSTVARTLPALTKQALADGWRFSGRMGWSCPECADAAAQRESAAVSDEYKRRGKA